MPDELRDLISSAAYAQELYGDDELERYAAMTPVQRFASDWNMPEDRVTTMVRLAKSCGRLNEKACNGDPHPHNRTPSDKNHNSEMWTHDCNVATAAMERFVEAYGFTVAYTGLYPCLKRGEQFVEIPY